MGIISLVFEEHELNENEMSIYFDWYLTIEDDSVNDCWIIEKDINENRSCIEFQYCNYIAIIIYYNSLQAYSSLLYYMMGIMAVHLTFSDIS